MKIHKKFDHPLPGFSVWGKRDSINIRINFAEIKTNEELPEEPLHYHKNRVTYFCVTEGVLIVEVDNKKIEVTRDSMLEVAPKEVYRVVGVGKEGCRVVVIGNHNDLDRIVVK